MRFISAIGAYRIVAIHDEVTRDADGYTRTVRPGYTVEFKQGILLPYEKELARTVLQFPGGVVDRRNVDGSPYDYIPLASVFDSEWIEDEKMRARVEQILLNNPGCGNPADYILVEEPKVEAPWPNYDELTIHGRRDAAHVAEKNLETAATIGGDINQMIAYEKQNRNDERIVAAYESALLDKENTTPAEELIQA